MPKWVPEIQQIAALIGPQPEGREATIFMTSDAWAELAREVREEYGSSVTPTNDNFERVQVASCFFVNAGTEDHREVNMRNLQEAERVNFAWRRDHFRKVN